MRIRWSLVFPLFFCFYAFIGLFIVRDYGISWDEPISRTNGMLTYNYIVEGKQDLFTHIERHHGSAFELPLVVIEAALKLVDTRDIYIARHIATFGFFFLSVLVFSWMIYRSFRDPWLTVLGTILLVLTPRIFADSFYNSKDIPLLATGIWWAAATREFLLSGKKRWAILSSVAAGIAIDIRVVGIVFPVLTGMAVLAKMWLQRRVLRRWGISTVVGVTVLLFTILIFWPFLWRNPVHYFIEALIQARAFPWEANVLYLGKYIKAADVPWHYPYVWIALTTPISYFLLSGIGGISLVVKHVRAFRSGWQHDVLGFLALGWVGIPLLSVTVGNAVLYDGWRHLYFIYPGMIILAVYGLQRIGIHTVLEGTSKNIYRCLAAAILLIDMVFVLGFMVWHHPHQQVYFNLLSGGMKQAKRNFEGDYWGLSFKQGLEYLLGQDSRPVLKVMSVNGPPNPQDILFAKDKRRIQMVTDIRQADYLLTVFRGYNYSQPERVRPDYTISVDGAEIFGLYKITR